MVFFRFVFLCVFVFLLSANAENHFSWLSYSCISNDCSLLDHYALRLLYAQLTVWFMFGCQQFDTIVVRVAWPLDKIAWLLSPYDTRARSRLGLWVTLHFSLMFQVWPRYFSLLDRNRFYFSFIYLILRTFFIFPWILDLPLAYLAKTVFCVCCCSFFFHVKSDHFF